MSSACFIVESADTVIQGKNKSSIASAYSAKPARDKLYSGKFIVSRANVCYRAFLRFDMKDLPLSNVRDAAIMLYSTKQYYKRPCRINLHQITSKWHEKYLTYNNCGKNTKWKKPGGDYKEIPVAYTDIQAEYINGWVCIKGAKLTELVKSWLKDPDNNHGVMLCSAFHCRGQTMKFFAGKLYSHEDKMPKLIVSDKKIDPAAYGVISPLELVKNQLSNKLGHIEKTVPAQICQKLRGDFSNMSRRINLLQTASSSQINVISSDIDRLYIKALTAGFSGRNFTVWNLSPWHRLDKFSYPDSGKPTLSAEMLNDEYLEQSLAVTNTGSKELVLEVKVTTGKFPSKNITKRASYWVKGIKPKSERKPDQDNFVWIDDALPLLQKDKFMTLKPGETRRLWLTLNSHNVSAGLYEMKIQIADAFGDKRNIPLKIKIYSTRLEKDSELHVYTYAYLNRRSTSDYMKTAIKDLKEHYQNTFVLNLIPQYNPETGIADYSHIKNYVEKIPDAKKILFFWNCESGKIPFCPAKNWRSEQWKNTLKKVIEGWYTELEAAGFKKDRIVMYPFDETYDNKCCGRTEYEALGDVARELHQIDPAILVFADPVGFNRKDMSAINSLKKDINIWAPVQELYHPGNKKSWPHPYSFDDKLQARSFFKAEQKAGKGLWTYQCDGPNKLLDVNGYFRQYPWRGWFFGVTGLGIWSYNDIRGGTGWSDADSGDFSMIYELRDAPADITTDPFEPLIPSRRWQAFRAGIQDYLLLKMLERKGVPKSRLKDIAREILKQSNNPDAYHKARQVLLNKLNAN